MAQEGWVEYLGQDRDLDLWRPGDKGRRLTATQLLKRIPRSRGKAIIAGLLREARVINAEPGCSRRITEVLLFGSMLPGRSKSAVGDVDVVVEICRRVLPRETLEALQEAERKSAPDYVLSGYESRLYWPYTRLKQRLRAVSRYLSFHAEDDLSAGVPYQQIYAYDLKNEVELAANPAVQRRRNKNTGPAILEHLMEEEEAQGLPQRPPRNWPDSEENLGYMLFHLEQGIRAQHLWTSGASLKTIRERSGMHAEYAQVYLAAQAYRYGAQAKTGCSLKDTVLSVLPDKRDFEVTVSCELDSGEFDIHINKENESEKESRLTGVLRRSRHDTTLQVTDPVVIPILEDIQRVLIGWNKPFKKHLAGLRVTVCTTCHPKDRRVEQGVLRPARLEQLAQAMEALLSSYQAPDGGQALVTLTVTLSQPTRIQLFSETGPLPIKRVNRTLRQKVLQVAEHTIAQYPYLVDKTESVLWDLRLFGVYADSKIRLL